MIPFERGNRLPRLHPQDQLEALKRSWWYCWHKLNSKARCIYGDIQGTPDLDAPDLGGTFDVVIAGAIVEHLADPISAIGTMARHADEAVIIAFTLVHDTDDQLMVTANDWSRPQFDYTWWNLSRGLYRRVFDNLGFDIEIKPSTAIFNGQTEVRSTIVATRR